MFSSEFNNLNDTIIIIDHLTGKKNFYDITSEYKNDHVICTKRFPIIRTKQIEIVLKSEKKLYEIDFILNSIFTKRCKRNLQKICFFIRII